MMTPLWRFRFIWRLLSAGAFLCLWPINLNSEPQKGDVIIGHIRTATGVLLPLHNSDFRSVQGGDGPAQVPDDGETTLIPRLLARHQLNHSDQSAFIEAGENSNGKSEPDPQKPGEGDADLAPLPADQANGWILAPDRFLLPFCREDLGYCPARIKDDGEMTLIPRLQKRKAKECRH